MNLLHTSDWHLGQSFFTQTRRAEHQQFLDWLLVQIRELQIDAVIVAGDVFDTGTPPSYAREMYNRFIVACSQLGCTLVVLGGNHDSVSTLNESRELVACLNTYVVAAASEPAEHLLELKNADGDIGALLCAVPFLRARDLLQSQAGESGLEKRQALGDAIGGFYAEVYQAALARREALMAAGGVAVPIVATGHLTALGVSQSESVRDIYIGSLDGFDASGFPPADYIALGHIHRPQVVAKREHIRYSGSPIPLGFDEVKAPRQVLKVSFDADLTAQIEPVEVPLFQELAVIRGNLAEIEQALQVFVGRTDAAPVWLSIEVQSDDFLADLPQRIQTLTEGLPVLVLQLRRARNTARESLQQQQQETLAELTPMDVFERRLALEQFDGEDAEQRCGRIRQRFSRILEETEQAVE